MKKEKLYVFIMLLLGIVGIWRQSSNCQAAIYEGEYRGTYYDDQGVLYEYIDTSDEVEKDPFVGIVVRGIKQTYNDLGKPKVTEIMIPDVIDGIPVRSIDMNAFQNHREITSIICGEELKWVGMSAFEGCTGLKTVTFNKKLRRIGIKSFKDCTGLETINFNGNLEEILEGAFEGCTRLKTVAIPKGVDHIGERTFANCKNLSEVKILGAPWVDDNAFNNTKILTAARTKAKDKMVIIDGVLIEGNQFSGKLALNGKRIKVIAANAFYKNKKLKSIQINGVKKIGYAAFYKCNAKNVTLKNIDSIDGGSFEESRINSVVLQNVNTVYAMAFWKCSTRKVILKQVKKMYIGVFQDCNQLKVVKLSGVKTIGSSAFENCERLEKVFIGKATQTFGCCCFSGCIKLKKLVITSKKKLNWKIDQRIWQRNKLKIKPFNSCDSLKHVYLKSGKVSRSIKEVFEKKVTLHVPKGKEKAYRKYVKCRVV